MLGGWSLCHSELYDNGLSDTKVGQIQRKCSLDKVMMACRKVGSNVLTVLAWAERETIFQVTDEPSCCDDLLDGNCKGNVAHGTKWYRAVDSKNYINGHWGFANSTDEICIHGIYELGHLGDPGTESTRLSYPTTTKENFGGFRCGDNQQLWYSAQWEKVFFHSDWLN